MAEELGRRSVRPALRALSIRKSEVALGRFHLIPRASIPTFRALAEKYEKLDSIDKKGRASEHYVVQMLVNILCKLRMDGLTGEDAEKFKAMRCRKVKPATANRDERSHMMSKALGWKYLARNPFKGIKPLEVAARGERTLEFDEEPRLLAACDRVRSRLLRPAILLALNTGMRRASFCHCNGRSWR